MTIRFRFLVDEQRYMLLLADLQTALVSHMPPTSLPESSRVVAKLLDMAFFEGLRQGTAAAAIANTAKAVGWPGPTLESLKAFQLHAHVYGSSDTPLHGMELEWLSKLGVTQPPGAWLDPNPMRFAPAPSPPDQYGTVMARALSHGLIRQHERPAAPPDYRGSLGDDASLDDIERALDAEPVQVRPDALNRIRDALLTLAANNYRPGSWQEMVFRLHLQLSMDAGFIDLMLGSPQGQAVLQQAGYLNLAPNALGLDLSALDEGLPARGPAPTPNDGTDDE